MFYTVIFQYAVSICLDFFFFFLNFAFRFPFNSAAYRAILALGPASVLWDLEGGDRDRKIGKCCSSSSTIQFWRRDNIGIWKRNKKTHIFRKCSSFYFIVNPKYEHYPSDHSRCRGSPRAIVCSHL